MWLRRNVILSIDILSECCRRFVPKYCHCCGKLMMCSFRNTVVNDRFKMLSICSRNVLKCCQEKFCQKLLFFELMPDWLSFLYARRDTLRSYSTNRSLPADCLDFSLLLVGWPSTCAFVKIFKILKIFFYYRFQRSCAGSPRHSSSLCAGNSCHLNLFLDRGLIHGNFVN